MKLKKLSMYINNLNLSRFFNQHKKDIHKTYKLISSQLSFGYFWHYQDGLFISDFYVQYDEFYFYLQLFSNPCSIIFHYLVLTFL